MDALYSTTPRYLSCQSSVSLIYRIVTGLQVVDRAADVLGPRNHMVALQVAGILYIRTQITTAFMGALVHWIDKCPAASQYEIDRAEPQLVIKIAAKD